MSKKVVFLDIDGTIWDAVNYIPESTVTAIHKMQENGHAVFINSGRSRSFIREQKLLDIGFDGIVSGCWKPFEKELSADLFDGSAPGPALEAHWQVYQAFMD